MSCSVGALPFTKDVVNGATFTVYYKWPVGEQPGLHPLEEAPVATQMRADLKSRREARKWKAYLPYPLLRLLGHRGAQQAVSKRVRNRENKLLQKAARIAASSEAKIKFATRGCKGFEGGAIANEANDSPSDEGDFSMSGMI